MDVKIEPGWKNRLSQEFEKEYFVRLTGFIKDEYRNSRIYPPGSLIFNAFDVCPFEKSKQLLSDRILIMVRARLMDYAFQ